MVFICSWLFLNTVFILRGQIRTAVLFELSALAGELIYRFTTENGKRNMKRKLHSVLRDRYSVFRDRYSGFRDRYSSFRDRFCFLKIIDLKVV